MALVNPNIAMSFKPTTEYQPRNVLADYADVQRIQSGQMEMQEYRRKSEGLERIRTAISKAGGPDDLETAALEMMKVPEYFEQGYGIYQTIRDKKAYEAYLKGQQPVAGTPTAQTQPAVAPTARVTPGALGSGTFDPTAPIVLAPPDRRIRRIATKEDLAQQQLLEKMGLSQPPVQRPTNALDPSIIERIGLSQPSGASTRGYAPETGNAPALFTPAPTNALAPTVQTPVAQAPVNALAPASVDRRTAIRNEIAQLFNFNDPRAAVRIRQLEQQLTAMEPRVVGGSVYYPDTDEFKTPTKPSSKLIPVLVNGQPTLVPEEQAVGMTPATAQTMRGMGVGRAPATGGRVAAAPATETGAPAGKPMTELQQRKAKQEQVTELQGVKAARSVTSELEKLTDELAGNTEKGIPRHPGYSRIVGFEALNPFTLPGGDAARAEQKLETFKGKISTFGRQLATQFGKLGNMAVQEWKLVSDSVQNINPRAGNLDEQMRDVVRQARDFEKTMQDKYNALYGNEAQQPNTPAQPSTKGSRTVTRTGMHNGKRVIQYSDGSLEYAD